MISVSIALLAIFVSSILVIIIQWIVRRHQKLQVLKRYGIPGPKPSFFDGNLFETRKGHLPHKVIDTWLKKYGNVFGYYTGEVPYIVVNDLDILKQVMIKDFSVFPNRPYLYMNIEPNDKSIIGLRDVRWKEVRSVISPTFSTSKLKLYKNIFDKKVAITVDIITEKAKSGEIFDIYPIFQGLTLDVIADSALAMKTRSQEDKNDKLMVALRQFLDTAHSTFLDIGIMFPFLETIFTFIINNFASEGQVNQVIVSHVKQVIELRRKNPELRSMDVLQLMLDSKDENSQGIKLTDDEIIANAYASLIAGYETTSTTLAYTLYLLIKHPDIQETLFREIDEAPDSTYTTLQELAYLNQVFDESLRLYPPVTGFVSRHCKQDHTIGAYTFPKDSVILIPVWQIHHDPNNFPDPFKFDPERFSPENKNSIKSMSYLPFGDGPRNCVGSRFAQLEMRLALFKLLKKFKFEACEKTEENMTLITPTLITNPANGVWVRALLRNAND